MISELSPETLETPAGRLPRWPGLVLLTCAAAVLVGCEEQPIAHYKVPHEKEVVAPQGMPGGPAMAKQDRIVAAFLPVDAQSFRFFKMSGDRDLVERAKPAFVQFLEKSVDPQKSPDKWESLPPGWSFDPRPRSQREATFLVKDPPLEVAISTAQGTELENVNRWRGQVGLPLVKEEDLPRLVSGQKIGGRDGKLVDVARPQPSWTVPAGWEKTNPVEFSIATFKIGPKDPNARVTVSPFPKKAFDLMMAKNVNRWRGQVGLEELEPDNAIKELKPDDVVNGYRVDYSKGNQRLIVVLVAQGDTSWVFKMSGSKEAVGDQQGAFDTFLRSVTFTAQPAQGEK